MTLTHAYATLVQVKNNDVIKVSDDTHDTALEDTMNGVSREIDYWTGRRFWADVETRYYTPKKARELRVNEIADTTSFALYTDIDGDGTYEQAWASTDYVLLPENALLDDEAYNKIIVAPLSSLIFPQRAKSVKLTANFGYLATPPLVNRACVLQTAILWSRYKTPLGVAGSTTIGTVNMYVPGLDPAVQDLLKRYKKYV